MKKNVLIISIVIAAVLAAFVGHSVFTDKLDIPKNSVYYGNTDSCGLKT